MKTAVIYARVSSKEQEREGYSIPVQLKALNEYAIKNSYTVLREFKDTETAKHTGRRNFSAMLQFISDQKHRPVILVEKTDRLYRNFDDSILIRDLGPDIHFVKEGRVVGKDSRSNDVFIHDINLVMAKNYSHNLKEEVRKGMEGKAEAGWYPTKAPIGYVNSRSLRTIDVNPQTSPIVTRIFERFASGKYSLSALRKQIRLETGRTLSKAYLAVLLKNPFYIGFFEWRGKRYLGKHPVFVDRNLFDEVQSVFARSGKPGKYRKHDFAFRGILRCAFDGCTVTAGLQKSKYVYYRCTGYRGKCDLRYMREELVSKQLGELLKNIYVPETVAQQIVETFRNSRELVEQKAALEKQILQQRISSIRNRIDALYTDKLDGKIPQDFFERKFQEWQDEEQSLKFWLLKLEKTPIQDFVVDVQRIFELAERAYSLYLTRNAHEQGDLLRKVVLNCETDGVTLTPTYRKPFDLIFQRAKNQDWSGRQDLNL